MLCVRGSVNYGYSSSLTYFRCLGELNLDCLNCTQVRTDTFSWQDFICGITASTERTVRFLVGSAQSSRWYDVWRNVHPHHKTEVYRKKMYLASSLKTEVYFDNG